MLNHHKLSEEVVASGVPSWSLSYLLLEKSGLAGRTGGESGHFDFSFELGNGGRHDFDRLQQHVFVCWAQVALFNALDQNLGRKSGNV